MLYQRLLDESHRLSSIIDSISDKLKSLPKGKLVCSRTGKYVKWYNSDGKNYTYIPKKEVSLAQSLAKKAFLKCVLSDCIQERRAIGFYLRHHNKNVTKVEQLFAKDPEYVRLLADNFRPLSLELDEWMHESYPQNDSFPQSLIHRTCTGHLVRSKSEVLIVTYLSFHKLPFRYEECVILGNSVYHPDFTIRHPVTGKTYYWEHLGLLDDPDYAQKAFNKLYTYSLYGILPDKNLILTYEYKDHPLTTETIENIIHYYFL